MTPPLLPEPPVAADAEALFATADIVLDTNVVLNLYRMSRGTRDAWFEVLGRVREQLVMPHQVAVEVTRNVPTVRSSLPDSYDALRQQVDGLRKAPAAHFTGSRHLHSERITALKAMLDRHLDRALSELQEIRDRDEAVVDADRDSVMAALDEVYGGRVLPEPSAATIRRRVERFREHRAPNEVPPGWKDARPGGKSTPLLAAGDYLLWAEVLNHARESGRRFIVVTDDAKLDWWHKEHGKVAPNPAMVAEAVRVTGHAHAQLNSESFLELAQRLLAITENEAAVEETAEIGAARSAVDAGFVTNIDDSWGEVVLRTDPTDPDRLLVIQPKFSPRVAGNWRRWAASLESEGRQDLRTRTRVVEELFGPLTEGEMRALPQWTRQRLALYLPEFAKLFEPDVGDDEPEGAS